MTILELIIRVYDRTIVAKHVRAYYEDSGFFNFGYWSPQTTSQREACEALVDQLLGRIAIKGGRILDVACGIGASTRRIAESYALDMITGINISEAQIAEARRRVPGCTFIRMDAAHLQFPDCHFDTVICVEAAFHFDTRQAFLREALRVLKPGGSLVLSDILFRRIVTPIVELTQVPRDNFVRDIASYSKRLEAAGFVAIDVQDSTDACVGPFRKHLARWPASQRKAGRVSFRKGIMRSIGARAIAGFFGVACKTYVLAAARKPALA